MMTSKHSSQHQLTLCAEGSPAKTLATQENVLALAENVADCGLICSGWFARLDRSSLSWKTSQRCLLEEWASYSGTWPQSGTMRNGFCYRREPLVLHISDAGFSLLLTPGWLFPTPVSSAIVAKIGENAGGTGIRATARKNGTFIEKDVNPAFQEWLMGFPLGWTDCEASETQSCRKSQSGSGDV